MWLKRFGENLKRDCRKITLHGFINVSESKSTIEMCFWISVQVTCFVLCLWLMTIHWLRYESRPTVTTIKSTAFPISDIPFPSVTVCSSNAVYKNNTSYYEKLLINEGLNKTLIQNYFANLKLLIHLNAISTMNTTIFMEIENFLEKNKISISNLMKSLSHPCNEMLVSCTWSNVNYNCSDMFRLIKTGLGYCCAFNDFNDIQVATESSEIFNKPVISDGAGIAHGLGLILNIGMDQYISPVLPFYASFVMINPIWDYSDLSAFSIAMQPGDFALLQLIPTVYTGDENLRQISVEDRNCWFADEGNLEAKKEYSFTNCVNECKRKAIYKLCKCVPFFYPAGDKNRKQCTMQDIPCLKKNERKTLGNITNCDCLPQCEDVHYDGYSNIIRSSLPENATSIYIYYDHSWCVEYGKSLNVTWDMLLASLGGIFGLCLGGSLISLIEIIYYIIKNIITTTVQGKKVSVHNINNKFPNTRKFQVQPKY